MGSFIWFHLTEIRTKCLHVRHHVVQNIVKLNFEEGRGAVKMHSRSLGRSVSRAVSCFQWYVIKAKTMKQSWKTSRLHVSNDNKIQYCVDNSSVKHKILPDCKVKVPDIKRHFRCECWHDKDYQDIEWSVYFPRCRCCTIFSWEMITELRTWTCRRLSTASLFSFSHPWWSTWWALPMWRIWSTKSMPSMIPLVIWQNTFNESAGDLTKYF